MTLEEATSLSSTEAVAERLELLRELIGMRQNEFASRAGIGANAWNNYVHCRSRISVDAAIKLVITYGVTLDFIFLGDASNMPYRLASGLDALRRARQDVQ